MLKFTKEGLVRYTSHLDMVRTFKRVFSRAGIRLAYSSGFNPHPKLSFAQPLSLGYSSISEWLEFETIENLECDFLLEVLMKQLPEGIQALEVSEIPKEVKSLASRCSAAEYMISFPINKVISEQSSDVSSLLSTDAGASFLAQNEILVQKKSKGKSVSLIDIKPMIRWLRISYVDDIIFMSTMLDAGSKSNLSPERLLDAVQHFYQFRIPRDCVDILRTDMEM